MSVVVGSAVGYLDLDINGFVSNLKTARQEADGQLDTLNKKMSSKFSSAGKSLTSAGKSLATKVTLPIVGMGTAIVKTSSDFESAMSKVKAISGATGDEVNQLSNKAKEMGAKTKFTAKESADAFTYMAMAGWETKEMLEGVDGVMNLAAADGLDLATTSDIVTDAITAFGLEASDSAHFADVLAKASSSANTNVSMLGESFKFIGPVAGAFGYSAEDTSIALGLMANSGIKAGQAGTSLRSALVRMADPSDEAAGAMERYGISLQDSNGEMKSLQDVMKMLKSQLGGLTKEQQIQTASTIFGKEAMSGMLAIINSSESDFDSLSDAIYNADGAAQEMAETMLDNLSGQFTLLMSALEGVALQLGEIILPYVKQFVEKVQQWVDWFSNLSKSHQELIVKVAAFAALLGPLLITLGKLFTSIGSIANVFGKLPGVFSTVTKGFGLLKASLLTNPFTLVIVAIGALVAAFVHLWKTNEEFREKIIAIWNGIVDSFKAFTQGIVDKINALGFEFEDISEMIKSIWEGLCNFLAPIFEGAFEVIANVLSTAFDIILGILDIAIGLFTGNWEQLWNGIKTIFQSVWKGLINWFKTLIKTMKGIFNEMLKWFGTSWEKLWKDVGDFFSKTWENILSFFTSIIDNIKNALSNFIDSTITFFSELPSKIGEFIQQSYLKVVDWASNMIKKSVETGKGFLENIIKFFKELPYNIGYLVGVALATIVKWVTNMIEKSIELGKLFVENIIKFFSELPGKIENIIVTVFQKVNEWVTNMIKKAYELGTNFVKNIVDFFIQLPGKVKLFIDSTLDNVRIWVTEMVNKAIETGTKFVSSVIEKLIALPGKVKDILVMTIKEAANWVIEMAKKGAESIKALIDSFIEGAKEIPEKMAEIGVNMVKGVWDGIVSMTKWFTKQVTRFFEGIVDGVKETLGIHSPSRVMADEVGKWLPLGVVEGFESSMPKAIKEIQESLDEGIDNIDADVDNLFSDFNVSSVLSVLKDYYNNVALFFESIEKRIDDSISNMLMNTKMLINEASLVAPGNSFGYVGYGGFSSSQPRIESVDFERNDKNANASGDTFVFYSPQPIDEIEASRLLKKTKRDLSEGF